MTEFEHMAQDSRTLETRSWANWVLIVWTAVVVTLGLGAALILLREHNPDSPWPWSDIQAILIATLGLAVLGFSLYLTRQQRHLVELREELIEARLRQDRRVERDHHRLHALLQVSRTMASATDPRAVFDAITEGCRETFRCDRVSLMLLDRDGASLEVRSAAGDRDLHDLIGARVRVGEGVAGWVAENRQPLVLGNKVSSGEYEGYQDRDEQPQAAMIMPIELRDELIGVINVGSHRPGASYDEEDLEALQLFAENAGICCRHAEQADWMRQTIRRMDAALQERDDEHDLAS